MFTKRPASSTEFGSKCVPKFNTSYLPLDHTVDELYHLRVSEAVLRIQTLKQTGSLDSDDDHINTAVSDRSALFFKSNQRKLKRETDQI